MKLDYKLYILNFLSNLGISCTVPPLISEQKGVGCLERFQTPVFFFSLCPAAFWLCSGLEDFCQGKWIDAPNDIINLKNFHDMIVRWHHLEESNTSDCLKHYGTNKKWSPEEKYELVARVIAGDTITSVAYTVGINSGLLAQWIRKYKIWGYNGLVGRRKGRKPKESAMKKMNINNPRKLNESEYEELIRLRAEITYIKAENEAIKKEIALREEREAALLKAKKQQSSKNSKKKDIC